MNTSIDAKKSGITSNAKKRLPLNVITNFASLLLTTLIALWLTPFLVEKFGVAVYGILPLLLSLLKYFNLISGALTSAVARFLTINIQKNNYKLANQYYSTALLSIIGIGIVLFSLALIILPWLENIITIPEGYVSQTKGLFLLIVATTVIQVISTVYNVGFFANHRFDLQNTIKIIAHLLKAFSIGIGLIYISKSLYVVGGSYLLLSLVLLTGGLVFLRKMEPALRFSTNSFSFSALKEISTMGTWTLLNNIGVLFYYNIDFIIINKMLGPKPGGLYAPIIQLSLLVTLIVTSLNTIFSPIIFEAIAHNDQKRIQLHTYKAIKYIGIVILLPIVFLCGFSKSVLTIWLGESFVDLYKLLWLLMVPLIITNSIRPLFALLNGLNAVKHLGIVTLLGGLLNLILSILLVKFTDLGLFAVALSTIISLFLRNILFLPIYSMKLISGRVYEIYRPLSISLISCVISVWALNWINYKIPPSNLLMLVCYFLFFSVVYSACIYLLVLNKNDKNLVLKWVRQLVPGNGN